MLVILANDIGSYATTEFQKHMLMFLQRDIKLGRLHVITFYVLSRKTNNVKAITIPMSTRVDVPKRGMPAANFTKDTGVGREG